MRNFLKIIGFLTIIIVCLTAGVAMITEIIKLYRELPPPPSIAIETNQATPSQGVVCNQQGNMLPIPNAPPDGCVLTVEWWYPPNSTPCGLWITDSAVEFNEGVAGYWWYEYDTTVLTHIQSFQSKYNYCEVKDFR